MPDEPKSKKFTPNKSKAFKLNDLDQEGAFFAFRIEGDQNSIKERIKDISNEMDLKKYKTSNLDIYQSDLFWKSINSLQLFSETKNNLLRAVVPPDLIMSPFPLTPLKPKIKSLTLPTLNLLEPAKLQETHPPAVPCLLYTSDAADE